MSAAVTDRTIAGGAAAQRAPRPLPDEDHVFVITDDAPAAALPAILLCGDAVYDLAPQRAVPHRAAGNAAGSRARRAAAHPYANGVSQSLGAGAWGAAAAGPVSTAVPQHRPQGVFADVLLPAPAASGAAVLRPRYTRTALDLGHATAAETLDTYAHLWPDSDDRTREAIDSVLGAAVSPEVDDYGA